jgi:hypothetical protein
VDGALVPNTPEGAAAPVPPASGVAVEVAAEMTVSEEEVPDPVNPAATQGLARARAAADEAVAAGRSASDAVLDSLVRSADDGDRETAIGLALAADPPRIDRLLQIARDAAVGGSLRATALYAAVEAAEGDADVGAAVADLAADRDVVVRRTAIELFPRIGVRGAERAILLLRSGDYPDELLAPLANAVAMSEKALDFLLGRSEPDAAFAVITALGETEPADAATRAALLARLPDVVRPLLGTPEMLLHAEEAFGACASAGHAAFLRSVAVAASLPTSIRLAAVDAAANDDACADGLPSLVSAVLADGRNPVELLRAVLARVPPELVADDAVRSSITALAESHANAWLREEARAKLQSVPASSEDGALRIVSATYGKDGSTIEVTAALRAMVVGGRLVVEAGNDLAGDPLVGVVKDLAVVYVWKGERRTRTIHEYEVLTLP